MINASSVGGGWDLSGDIVGVEMSSGMGVCNPPELQSLTLASSLPLSHTGLLYST